MENFIQNTCNLKDNTEYITINLETKKNCKIKVAGTFEEPYFRMKDICEILEYPNVEQTLQKYVQPEDQKSSRELNISQDDNETIYISEPGIYYLILQSKSKFVKELKRVLFTQILPSMIKSQRMTQKNPDKMKLDRLRENIIKFFDILENNIIIRRNDLLDMISIQSSFFDDKILWKEIKETVGWKNSKTPFFINNKSFIIKYR